MKGYFPARTKVAESVVAGRERLSKTDIGVMGWRKIASANDHRDPRPSRPHR